MKQMTTEDKRWDEFCGKLEGKGYCDFKKDGTWTCYKNHKFARKLLAEMGYDIESSIKYFKERGGFCDCEILFAVLCNFGDNVDE